MGTWSLPSEWQVPQSLHILVVMLIAVLTGFGFNSARCQAKPKSRSRTGASTGIRSLLIIAFLPWFLAPSELPSNAICELDKEQKDLTIWPNCDSSGNSDPWLIANHDKIGKMKPRVLVVNFANDVDMDGVKDRTRRLVRAFAESTRYHGYSNPDAPPFIEFQVLKYIDMRDNPIPADRGRKNSLKAPYDAARDKSVDSGVCDYSAFYGEEFATLYGFENPKEKGKYLSLNDLINQGIVHELWFYWIHDEDGAPFETVEFKQYYDLKCQPIQGKHGWAGNGHSPKIPWTGRSFRITFINPHRGIGCAMENFGHAMEGMAHSDSIQYFRKYFYEYAEFDLDARLHLPGKSLYELCDGASPPVEYPSPTQMKLIFRGKEYKVENYIHRAGNVHFPPGARNHYDLSSPFTVKSTIENYRLRNGPGKSDKAEDFSKEKFRTWLEFCPDGTGPWLVFWRQNMPGLGNKCLDDDGLPMKNWWPFLFY